MGGYPEPCGYDCIKRSESVGTRQAERLHARRAARPRLYRRRPHRARQVIRLRAHVPPLRRRRPLKGGLVVTLQSYLRCKQLCAANYFAKLKQKSKTAKFSAKKSSSPPKSGGGLPSGWRSASLHPDGVRLPPHHDNQPSQPWPCRRLRPRAGGRLGWCVGRFGGEAAAERRGSAWR